jgi:hypothetical protein
VLAALSVAASDVAANVHSVTNTIMVTGAALAAGFVVIGTTRQKKRTLAAPVTTSAGINTMHTAVM